MAKTLYCAHCTVNRNSIFIMLPFKRKTLGQLQRKQANEKPIILCFLFFQYLHSNEKGKPITKMTFYFLNSHFYI